MNVKGFSSSSSTRSAPFAHDKAGYFWRLNRSERNQHLIFAICFLVLAVTGFMVQIPEDIVAKFGTTGEIIFALRGILHRAAGSIMILVCLYHVGYLLFSKSGRRWLQDMLPSIQDLKDMTANLGYLIGLKKQAPEFDRFCYKHKLEYGALIAGSFLMSATGILLWTEYRWNKFILDIASLVHQMEAILACLAIMIWHLYDIFLKPRKISIAGMWLTGKMPAEEMADEHSLHYRKIMNDPHLQDIYVVRENHPPAPARPAVKVSLDKISRIH